MRAINVKISNFLIILILLLTGCDRQLNAVWDMPTPYPDAVFHTKNINQFADDVKRMTNGTLSIRIHPGASLYKLPEIKRAVRSGQVPMGEILMSTLGNENPLYQIDSLPLLATSYQQAFDLWQVSHTEIADLLDKEDLKLLFSVPWPPQGLYTQKEINTVADMRGLKIRVYNAMLSRLAELVGGHPSTVQAAEIPQAFSTGIIDAMITSPSTGVSSQAWDYVSYYYDIQAWIPKNIVIVSKKSFASLPPDMQKAVEEAAKTAEERGWEMSTKETQDKTKTLADKGIRVIEPTPELTDSFNEVRQKMMEEWQNSAGASGAKILAAFKEKLAK